MIQPVRGKEPKIGEGSFVAASADIIGDVELGENSSVWFNAVLRGDVMPIKVGKETNIQDGTIVHGTFNKCGAEIGDRVTVGHNAILHGCKIGHNSLIGMGAIVMDKAVIGENSVVGAGALVTENSEFPPGHLIIGSPARAKRPLKDEELKFLGQSADNYLEYMSWFKKEGL